MLLLIEYLVKATPLLSTWNRPFKEQIHDSLRLKITHFLKRDTMRMTGGKMIMLDMMPTLISCKKEYFHPFMKKNSHLPGEIKHLGEAEVGVSEVAFHLAIPAKCKSESDFSLVGC